MVRPFKLAVAALLLALPTPAWAQGSLLQGGPFVAGRAPMYSAPGVSQAVVQDSGPAGGGGPGLGLSEFLQTNRAPGTGPYGAHTCLYDNPITNPAGYHYLCLDANASGGGLVAFGSGGGAAALPFNFIFNGSTYPFPFSTQGAIGPNPTTVNELAVWNNAVGTLLRQHAPAQLTDNKTSAIKTSASSLYVTSDGTTVDSLVGANISFQALAGVTNVPAGSTVINTAGVGAYMVDNAVNTDFGGSNASAFYGNVRTNAANAAAWGISTVCTTTPGFAGQACLNEFDVNYTNASDNGSGVLVAGNSSVQPSVAVAYNVGLLASFNTSGVQWTQGLYEEPGCCQKAIQIGATKATSGGVGVNGGTVEFDYFNSSGVAKTYTFLPTPTSFNIAGSDTNPNFIFGGNLVVSEPFGFTLANGAGGPGLEIGALGLSGASISSQIETFNYFDAAGAAQRYTIQALPGALTFSGTPPTSSQMGFEFGGNLVIATGFGFSMGPDEILAYSSGILTFALGSGISNVTIGNATATLSLNVANGGAATKYVCADASNKIVLQTAAC